MEWESRQVDQVSEKRNDFVKLAGKVLIEFTHKATVDALNFEM